ncbi:MAG TPA: hypothetical protein VMO47_05145 [Rhodothermales bacterium]|nr:hypothetical protein [Rhodothermales bacterium]
MFTFNATSRNRGTQFLLTALLLLIWSIIVPPAKAQTGNQSNGTSSIVTMSDGVGSAFAQSFKYGLSAEFTNPTVQLNLNQTALGLNRRLATGSLLILPIASTDGWIESAVTAQRTVLCVVTDEVSEQTAGCLSSLEQALRSHGHNKFLVHDLVEGLEGLMANDKVDPNDFVAALRAFERVVRKAPQQFVENPPQEFVVVHMLLSALINTANETGR